LAGLVSSGKISAQEINDGLLARIKQASTTKAGDVMRQKLNSLPASWKDEEEAQQTYDNWSSGYNSDMNALILKYGQPQGPDAGAKLQSDMAALEEKYGPEPERPALILRVSPYTLINAGFISSNTASQPEKAASEKLKQAGFIESPFFLNSLGNVAEDAADQLLAENKAEMPEWVDPT
jgi:hypothetical protein